VCGDRVRELVRSESKLLARRDRGREDLGAPFPWPLGVFGVRKLIVLPRRDNPVDERFFLLLSKSLALGSALFALGAGCRLLLPSVEQSRGDPGEGGVLDRVVVADLWKENRRFGFAMPLLIGGGRLATGTVFLFVGSSCDWLARG